MVASIRLDTQRTIGAISPLIFGGFAEHLGRCIYEGIYEPGSKFADENGLRTDVIAALRELDFPVMRYPGGNFVSNYRWEEGVGPKELRPRRKDLAWASIETNQFGTNEFVDFCRVLGTEPMMAVNLGTGSPEDAGNLVEYCNSPAGTKYADLRVSHGYPEPHKIKYWCLGNEMDGPWQCGHLTAEEYALKAHRAANIMKWHDPSIELILCGSSSNGMPRFPEWDRIALEECWEKVDYLSLHHYANNHDQDTQSFLGYAASFQAHLDALRGALMYVKAKRRSKHDVYLSWDEWNVWYKEMGGSGHWTEAPHLLEEVYNHEDALVVAQWLNVFLRNADVLKAACIAQIVNVIAPIITNSDGLFKQTIFHPIEMIRKLARGNSLQALVDCESIETKRFGTVPMLDVAAASEGSSVSAFVVNRSVTDSVSVKLSIADGPCAVSSARLLHHEDPKADNNFDRPENVVPQPFNSISIDRNEVSFELPAMSFLAIEFTLIQE